MIGLFFTEEKYNTCPHCREKAFLRGKDICISCRKNSLGNPVPEEEAKSLLSIPPGKMRQKKMLNRIFLVVFLALAILALVFTLSKLK